MMMMKSWYPLMMIVPVVVIMLITAAFFVGTSNAFHSGSSSISSRSFSSSVVVGSAASSSSFFSSPSHHHHYAQKKLEVSSSPCDVVVSDKTSSKQHQQLFFDKQQPPPYLALITNRNSCNNRDQFDKSRKTLQEILETNKVDLITVRVTRSTADPKLVQEMIDFLVNDWSNNNNNNNNNNNKPIVIVHQDWIEQGIRGKAHGIQIKEGSHELIPSIRKRFNASLQPQPQPQPQPIIIGMTVHSMESAQRVAPYGPNYLFVGSCFVSDDSHPEKQIVEGPELPGLIAQQLVAQAESQPNLSLPVIFAIGGIAIENCHVPIQKGAHGVTVIKSILQSTNPKDSVLEICNRTNQAYGYYYNNNNNNKVQK